MANQLYEFMRDMSLLIATGGVAYLSNIFLKWLKFIESLKEEWRNIVRTNRCRSARARNPISLTDDYLAVFYKSARRSTRCALSIATLAKPAA